VTASIARRDAGERPPRGIVLVSAWTDLRSGDEYQRETATDPLVSNAALATLSRFYRGGHDATDPLVSPVFADLAGMPPMLVLAGSTDALAGDSTLLAERARAAGVDVDLQIWPDMFHCWPLFWPILAEGRAAVEAIGAFITRRTVIGP
jgi:acetyl esterase/lipase